MKLFIFKHDNFLSFKELNYGELIPAILLVISAVALRLFPLDGPEWFKKLKYMMELHEQKEREYLQKLADEGKSKS